MKRESLMMENWRAQVTISMVDRNWLFLTMS